MTLCGSIYFERGFSDYDSLIIKNAYHHFKLKIRDTFYNSTDDTQLEYKPISGSEIQYRTRYPI
ncbi:hypothetical protein BADSM9389_18560 [Buttiauxella agrestis]|nr:hypothetical protein BADSM9389_18560 [Buttiauxella agrestis]